MRTSGLVLDEKPQVSSVTPTRLYDQSRYGNHGTWTAITPVRLPSGLWVNSFNGTTSYIQIPDSNILQPLIISVFAWVNLTSLAAVSQAILSKWGAVGNMSWMLNIDTGTQTLNIVISRDGTANLAASQNYTPLAGWNFCAGVFNGVNEVAYVNAVPGGAQGCVGTIFQSTANVQIGAEDGWAFPILGMIALSRVYKYALTASQIFTIYQAERGFFGV